MKTLLLLTVLFCLNVTSTTSLTPPLLTDPIKTNPKEIIDQEQPFAICIEEIELDLMEVTGTVVLTAKELEAGLSRDNQTEYENLIFSFSSQTEHQRIIFDCHSTGRNLIELWVTDEAGNQDYCTAEVYVTDSKKVCGMSHRASYMASL